MIKNKKVNRYTVNTRRPNEEGKTYTVFNNLRLARISAKEMFRTNNLVSLQNFKRVKLPI
jgi:hypothetical protein